LENGNSITLVSTRNGMAFYIMLYILLVRD